MILCLAMGLALWGCLPDPAFPDEPALTYVAFEPNDGGGRNFILRFPEGEGDVGLGHNHTHHPI